MNATNGWLLAAACGLGLVLTLVLAAWLTPRRWWRRPTAANLALAGGGTLAFALLFAAMLPSGSPRAGTLQAAPAPAPALRYRVIEDLNLRAARATGAPRLAVLPAGTLVTPVGAHADAHDGDWLRVRAFVKGKQVEGWTSSLWLRRVDERALAR